MGSGSRTCRGHAPRRKVSMSDLGSWGRRSRECWLDCSFSAPSGYILTLISELYRVRNSITKKRLVKILRFGEI